VLGRGCFILRKGKKTWRDAILHRKGREERHEVVLLGEDAKEKRSHTGLARKKGSAATRDRPLKEKKEGVKPARRTFKAEGEKKITDHTTTREGKEKKKKR